MHSRKNARKTQSRRERARTKLLSFSHTACFRTSPEAHRAGVVYSAGQEEREAGEGERARRKNACAHAVVLYTRVKERKRGRGGGGRENASDRALERSCLSNVFAVDKTSSKQRAFSLHLFPPLTSHMRARVSIGITGRALNLRIAELNAAERRVEMGHLVIVSSL